MMAMRVDASATWRRAFLRLNGPQTLGNSTGFWIAFGVVVGFLYVYPAWGETYGVSNSGYLLAWSFLAISVCLLWGYTGIFSFGQTAFFGLAGYAYGVAAINLLPVLGDTTIAVLAALLLTTLVALLVGYIMFYGGVSALYV